LERCTKAGVTSEDGLNRCTIDICYNMRSIEEVRREKLKHQVEKEKIERPRTVTPRPVQHQEGTCYSLGDPHYRTFANKLFNNYWVGDFVLVSGHHFTVHARTRKWNAAAVNKRIAANLNGDIVEAKSADKFTLNGDTLVDLNIGQKFQLPKGGMVERISSNRALYYSYKAGYLDAEYVGSGKMRYVNLIVKVPNWPATSGACNGNMVNAHGLFKHHLQMHQTQHQMKVSRSCHDRARIRCNAKGVAKKFLTSCIVDVCANLGTGGLRKGLRHFKQDKK